MTAFRPVDSKREEYRKYLERSGIMASLTRVLVSLYEEQDKGIDALDYMRSHLLENHPSQNASEEELRAQISRLVSENNMLRKRLSQYEDVPPPIAVVSTTKTQSLQQTEVASVHSGQSKASAPQSNPPSEKQSEQLPSTTSSQKE